jgi:endonuclease YncB( thermonuclease family)
VRYTVASPILILCLAVADVFAQDNPPERPPVRDVTPPGVNRIYQPLAPAAAGPTIPTEKFENARMQNDGSILADGRVLKLKGVAFPARNQLCGQPNGVRWACGMRAYGTARLALEHKALECEKTAAEADPRSSTHVTCWIERKDLALTLLERGWVYLADPAGAQKSYATAAAAAQANRIGLWADGPPEKVEKPKRPLAIP